MVKLNHQVMAQYQEKLSLHQIQMDLIDEIILALDPEAKSQVLHQKLNLSLQDQEKISWKVYQDQSTTRKAVVKMQTQ